MVGDTGLEPVTSCMSSIPTDALWPQTWPRLRIGGVKTVTPQRIGLWPTNRGTVQRSPENLAAAQHRADHSCSPRTTGARPALASTSMEQGRLAMCSAFGMDCISRPQLFPYGIYAIPEISTVGRTERGGRISHGRDRFVNG